MYQNPGFTLKYISDVPYLLPLGQMVADFRRGLKLNDTGCFIWEQLHSPCSFEELFDQCRKHYKITGNKLPAFQKEIRQFTDVLLAAGFLLEDAAIPPALRAKESPKNLHYFKIAELTLRVNSKKELLSESLFSFCCSPDDKARFSLNIAITSATPAPIEAGETLVKNDELTVCRAKTQFRLCFPTLPTVLEARIHESGMEAIIYCYDDHASSEEIFHVLRHIFLYAAQKCGMAALHSASLLYQDKAWLFSASSGTGKSTHVNLWQELWETPPINGDLNLLAMGDGLQPVVYGIPWCGTSGIFTVKTYPLGGIFLLHRDFTDHVEELTREGKEFLVSCRIISPVWTEEQLSANLGVTSVLTDFIMVARLYCTKNSSAALAAKEAIDNYLKTL